MTDTANLETLGQNLSEGFGQTLNSLMGRDVQIQFQCVQTVSAQDFASGLQGSLLISMLKGVGGFPGSALMIIREKDSAIIADLLIGQDGSSAPVKMSDLHLSAFGEVVQQLVDGLSGEIKKYAGPKSGYSVISTESKEVGDMGSILQSLGSDLAVVTYVLDVPGLFTGDLWICLPDLAASRLANPAGGLMTEQAPAMALAQNSGVPVNTSMRAGGTSMQQFDQEFSGSTHPAGGNIGLLLDVPLKLTVELGRTTKLVKEILALAPGSVVELDKLAGEAVDILVNEKPIAKGEVVVIDENFGVRITEILNPEERLTAVQS
jgi:flagellar motor switch protein FliN/FliY